MGVPSPIALRGCYPLMRHSHKKVHWIYVDGVGRFSRDPPCKGEAQVHDNGHLMPCTPCEALPWDPTMCKWMREERIADSSAEHWKLGFLKLSECAAGRRAEKRAVVRELRRVSNVCQTLVQKCDAHKALILAVVQDKRPLASRRAACLTAAKQSAVAVLEDMSKPIQVKLYSKDDRDLACLAAIGIRGSRLPCALNRARHLPSEDVSRGQCRLDPPLCPNQAPTAEFIVPRLPTTDRPLLWNVVTDEIFVDAMVGVMRNMNASGVCTPCCVAPFPLRSEEQIDFLVALALINFQEGKRKTALKSTCWVFAVSEGKLHGSVVHERTHVALNSEYGAVTGIPMLFNRAEMEC